MGQRSYTVAYRSDAVKLANDLGASGAAKQLKIPVDTLYTWISRAKIGDLPMSPMPPLRSAFVIAAVFYFSVRASARQIGRAIVDCNGNARTVFLPKDLCL